MAHLDVERDGPFLFWASTMEVEGDIGPEIKEAVGLTKREMALEEDLRLLIYNFTNARIPIENELARIRLRRGELMRKGEIPWR